MKKSSLYLISVLGSFFAVITLFSLKGDNGRLLMKQKTLRGEVGQLLDEVDQAHAQFPVFEQELKTFSTFSEIDTGSFYKIIQQKTPFQIELLEFARLKDRRSIWSKLRRDPSILSSNMSAKGLQPIRYRCSVKGNKYDLCNFLKKLEQEDDYIVVKRMDVDKVSDHLYQTVLILEYPELILSHKKSELLAFLSRGKDGLEAGH